MNDTGRLALKVSPEDKENIVLAARLERRSTSNFLEWAAVTRAEEVLKAHGVQGQAELDTHAPVGNPQEVRTSEPLQEVVEKVQAKLPVQASPGKPRLTALFKASGWRNEYERALGPRGVPDLQDFRDWLGDTVEYIDDGPARHFNPDDYKD